MFFFSPKTKDVQTSIAIRKPKFAKAAEPKQVRRRRPSGSFPGLPSIQSPTTKPLMVRWRRGLVRNGGEKAPLLDRGMIYIHIYHIYIYRYTMYDLVDMMHDIWDSSYDIWYMMYYNIYIYSDMVYNKYRYSTRIVSLLDHTKRSFTRSLDGTNQDFMGMSHLLWTKHPKLHRENGGTLGMVY